jgi:hypothetical protein
MDPRGTDPRNQDLRIQTGAFGDTRLTRDRRVEVPIITGN